MFQVLFNLVTLKALNTSPEVYYGLLGVWLMLVLAGLASVFSQSKGGLFKLFWLAAIVALPVIGLFLYSCYCVAAADYSFLKMLGLTSRKSYLRMQNAK